MKKNEEQKEILSTIEQSETQLEDFTLIDITDSIVRFCQWTPKRQQQVTITLS